jgi:rhodanese-related sulfurtransferase
MRRRVLLAVSIAAMLVAAAAVALARAPQQTMFPELDAPTVKKMLDEHANFVLVDARPENEYSMGHIKGAINIPPRKHQYMAGLLPENKDIPVVFYCRGYG